MNTTDVTKWKVTYEGAIVGQVLSFMRSLEQVKVLNKALDGTVYLQTIGDPIKKASFNIFSTIDEMHVFNIAEAAGSLFTFQYRGRNYTGYIAETLEWEPVEPGAYYTAPGVLLIETEGDAE